MSREQVSITELLLLVDSPELLEVEQVRAELNQLLSTGEYAGALIGVCDSLVCMVLAGKENSCVVTSSVSCQTEEVLLSHHWWSTT